MSGTDTDSQPQNHTASKAAASPASGSSPSSQNTDQPFVKKNPGNFANNPERAREAGRKGGKNSGGNFKNNPDRAREAGRKGGQK